MNTDLERRLILFIGQHGRRCASLWWWAIRHGIRQRDLRETLYWLALYERIDMTEGNSWTARVVLTLHGLALWSKFERESWEVV